MGIPIIAVHAEENIPTPSCDYFDELRAGQSLSESLLKEVGVTSDICADTVKYLLQSVPLPFQPKASAAELSYQASEIAARIEEVCDPFHAPSSLEFNSKLQTSSFTQVVPSRSALP